MKLVRQLNSSECGICCVAMIAQFYNINKPFRFFKDLLPAGRDGTTFMNLQKLLESIGIDSKIERIDALDISVQKFPLIAITNRRHFTVIKKINKRSNSLEVLDPAMGKCIISIEEYKENYIPVILYTIGTNDTIEQYLKRDKENSLRNFKDIILKLMPTLISVCFFTILTYLVTLIVPLFIQKFIDVYMVQTTFPEAKSNYIILLALLFSAIIMYTRVFFMKKLEVYLDELLSMKIIRKILNVGYSFYEIRNVGDTLYRISLMTNIKMLFTNSIINTIIGTGSMLCILAYMARISLTLTCILVAIVLLTLVFILFMNKKILNANNFELLENNILTIMQTEILSTIYSIKCMGNEQDIFEKYKIQYVRYKKKLEERVRLSGLSSTSVSLIQSFAPMFLLYIGTFYVLRGNVTIGEIVSFYTLCTLLFNSCISFFAELSNFQLIYNMLIRVNDILDVEDEKNLYSGIEIEEIKSIDMKVDYFSYSKSSSPVLQGINIHIQKGEKIGIVGSSGSGKSTLGKVLLGLYDVEHGSIEINGNNLGKICKQSYRKLFGVVPQDPLLFDKSIKENICMDKKISDKDLKKILYQVGLENDVKQMPMKEHTVVAEQGKGLSGGQRQRIALARALVYKPQILLLDEATSFVDSYNEKRINNTLLESECTQIIISHRLSSVKNCTRIYVMENGQIKEQGTHSELLEKKGVYYRLFGNNN